MREMAVEAVKQYLVPHKFVQLSLPRKPKCNRSLFINENLQNK